MSALDNKVSGGPRRGGALVAKIGGPGSRSPGTFLRKGALWIVVVLVGAALTFVVVANNKNSRGDAAGDDALDAVPARVEGLLSYDAATVTKDLKGKQAWLTGSFADDYEELVVEKVAPAALKDKTNAQAKVVEAGVSSAQTDRVVLIMFVNVNVTSPTLKTPQATGSRLRVTVERVDGEWLISELQPI